jgi:hypothetical protein
MKILATIAAGLRRLIAYIADIFDATTPTSFSRWATAVTILVGSWALVHIVRRTHALPDPLQLGALAAWMVSPYSVNKVVGIFNRNAYDRLASVQAVADAEVDIANSRRG